MSVVDVFRLDLLLVILAVFAFTARVPVKTSLLYFE